MSSAIIRLLGYSSGFVLATGLHIGAFAFLAADKGQHGIIESEVASVSINLLETKVIEDVVQGDVKNRRASDLDQAAQTSQQGSKEKPKETQPEQEIERQPEPVPKPKPETELIPAPEPEPVPEPQPDDEKLKQEALARTKLEEENRRKELIEKKQQQKKQAEAIAKKLEKAEADARRKIRERKKARAKAKAKARKAAKASRRTAATKKGTRRGQAKGTRSQSSGRRNASPGSVRAYAGRVQARIAGRRPSGGGRGTVKVTFAISSSGRLRFARVLRSSGNATLDRRALTAVRRSSPFPKPPSGMTSRQLTFSMPFRFR